MIQWIRERAVTPTAAVWSPTLKRDYELLESVMASCGENAQRNDITF
jgi:hypothetical protein